MIKKGGKNELKKVFKNLREYAEISKRRKKIICEDRATKKEK
jgi:hypothetical protein